MKMLSALRCLLTGARASALLICAVTGLAIVSTVFPTGLQVAFAEPPPLTKEQKRLREIDRFFSDGPIPSLEIKISKEEIEHLNKDQRSYVEATLTDGVKTWEKVALKLKGSAGSFQGLDAKPGFTLSFDKFKGATVFHGLKKLHLNNGVQDGTFLKELIAGEIARQAGVPASRCTHALVKLNGRELGLYVLKEPFNKDFLTAFFKSQEGELWDGGFCHEIDENMQKDQGDPEDKTALKQLIAACRENDAAKRWAALGAILDLEKFASFCVMEDFLAHWDGYNFNRNNYRVYRDGESGKISFFLHGMDQTFEDMNFPIQRDFGSMVGGAFMRCPEGAKLYRARAQELYDKTLKPSDWGLRVTQEGERVRAALEPKNPGFAKEYPNKINEARARVQQRIAGIGRQLGDMPKPPEFDKNNILRITSGWEPQPSGDAALSQADKDGKKCLLISAHNASAASWRKQVNLPPGKYRFESAVRTAAVQATKDDKGRGALLRISGGSGQQSVEGDTAWKPLAFEFESSGAPVTLVAELRAQRGDAWFDTETLRLVWLK